MNDQFTALKDKRRLLKVELKFEHARSTNETNAHENFSRFRFQWQDGARRAPNLARLSKLVAWAIWSYVNNETHVAYPSQALLAAELGVSTRAISKGVAELVEKKWIAKQRYNRGLSNRYVLLDTHLDAVRDWYEGEKDRLNEGRKAKLGSPRSGGRSERRFSSDRKHPSR